MSYSPPPSLAFARVPLSAEGEHKAWRTAKAQRG
jgi:hypothetical protein